VKKINSAEEASEIVRKFLTKTESSIFISPRKAEKTDGIWIVVFRVGFKDMEFELDAETGEILRFRTRE